MVSPRSSPPRWKDSRTDGVGAFLNSAAELTAEDARLGVRARVSRRILATRPAGSARWVPVSASVMLVAAAAVFLLVARPWIPELHDGTSSGDVQRPRGEIATGADGRATFTLGEGALAIGPRSRLATAPHRLSHLLVGTADLSAPAARRTSLLAGGYEVSVEGGMVRLEVLSAESVSAFVVEGEVVLRRGSRRINLTSGQSFRTAPPGKTPSALEGPGTRLALAPPLEDASLGNATLERARDEAQEGHTAAALRTYETLAHGPEGRGDSGIAAEVALYELARLELNAPGDLVAAERNLRDSLRRYPEGVLAREVSLSLLDLDVKVSHPELALSDAENFLQRFPDSERDADVRLIRANLLRGRGDCSRALPDYRRLSSSSEHAEDALFFEAVCEHSLAHTELAQKGFLRYLAQYRKGTHRTEAARLLGSEKFREGSAPLPTSRARPVTPNAR